jgi:hypothetical protein
MTEQELDQIRGIVQGAVAPLTDDVAGIKTDVAGVKAAQAATDARIDAGFNHLDAKLDTVLSGIANLKTETRNRDSGEDVEELRRRVETLEGRREQ